MLSPVAPLTIDDRALHDAKAYLRLDNNHEDELLRTLLSTAVELCESFIGQVSIERSFVETLEKHGDWQQLTAKPTSRIEQVQEYDSSEAWVEAEASHYEVRLDAVGTASVRSTRGAGLRVRYVAGMAESWDALPSTLRQGIVRLAVHLFTHRDAMEDSGPPAVVAALWRPWRRMRLK